MKNYSLSKEGVCRAVVYITPDIPVSAPYLKAVTNPKHVGKWKGPQPPCGDSKVLYWPDPKHFKTPFFNLFY